MAGFRGRNGSRHRWRYGPRRPLRRPDLCGEADSRDHFGEKKQSGLSNVKTWPCGLVARSYLRKMIDGKHVSCRIVDVNPDNRSVGRCFLGNTDIGVAMLHAGQAEAMLLYLPRNHGIDLAEYGYAENKARERFLKFGRRMWRAGILSTGPCLQISPPGNSQIGIDDWSARKAVPVTYSCHHYTMTAENALNPAIMRCNIGAVSTVYADETSCHIGAYSTPLIRLLLTLVRTSTRLPQSRKLEKSPRLRLLARQISRPWLPPLRSGPRVQHRLPSCP